MHLGSLTELDVHALEETIPMYTTVCDAVLQFWG